MEKIARDVSFVREGVPLDMWIMRLVSEEPAERTSANEAINAMRHALPSVHTPLRQLDAAHFDHAAHGERLKEALYDSATEQGVDTADLIRRLCALEIAADQEYGRHLAARKAITDVQDAKFDRMAKDLIETINTSPDAEVKREASRRFARLTSAYICGGKESDTLNPKVFSGGVVRTIVLEALADKLMLVPETIEAILEKPRIRYQGLRLLKKAGPIAVSFAPKLIERFDSASQTDSPMHVHSFSEDASTLAAIARGNREVIDALILRLDGGHFVTQASAALTLQLMDGELCGQNSEIVCAVRPWLAGDQLQFPAINLLASAGRDIGEVRRLVIDFARPAAPRLQTAPDFPQYEYDAAMVLRGVAIDAMRYFKDYPDECVPVLIDAIDTFVEFDPDESRSGAVSRVAGALRLFGERAAPAATALALHLNDEGHDCPRNILDALAVMGTSASPAISLLEGYLARKGRVLANVGIERDVDHVSWTIPKLRGT